jgi:23S rRNA (cytidine1920-2'-O)/16S rRNA (cytidine1409-2'-O)-methyltransferase
MTLRRLDAELVRRGLAATPEEAHAAVDAGRVTVAGITATKVATMVAGDAPLEIVGAERRQVSRGGAKLAAALDRFSVDPRDRDCLDAGASTGGFTERLLDRGAARVVAVDVGYGQLAWRLRSDPRVVVLERTNVRSLTPARLPFTPELVVADLSFSSLRGVVGVLAAVASDDAQYILLVKPQFEARRQDVGAGGVVREPAIWRAAIEEVVRAAVAAGLTPRAVMASPRPGPAGNVEFPLFLSGSGPVGDLDIDHAILEARELVG